MATTVLQVYEDVCRVLLEDEGLRYHYAEESFLKDLMACVRDFLGQTGVSKAVFTKQVVSGTAEYALDNQVVDPQAVFVNNKYMQPSSGFYMDQRSRLWSSDSNFPERWHSDRLDDGDIALSPTPNFTGAADSLKVIATQLPSAATLSIGDDIPLLPDSAAVYLKFGVLSKMFATNGEVKDVSRQRYCQARWQEGINLFRAMMDQEVDEPGGGKGV